MDDYKAANEAEQRAAASWRKDAGESFMAELANSPAWREAEKNLTQQFWQQTMDAGREVAAQKELSDKAEQKPPQR